MRACRIIVILEKIIFLTRINFIFYFKWYF